MPSTPPALVQVVISQVQVVCVESHEKTSGPAVSQSTSLASRSVPVVFKTQTPGFSEPPLA